MMLSILYNRAARRIALLVELIVVPIGLIALFHLLVEALPLVELRDAAVAVAASFGLALAGYALLAVRLARVLAAFGLALPHASVWHVHLTSLFYYFFLPAGIGYDFSKFAKIALRSADGRAWSATGAVIAERAVGGAGVYLLLLATLPFTRLVPGSRLDWLTPGPWAWALLVALVPLAAWLVARGARRGGYRPGALVPAVLVSAVAYLAIAAALSLAARSLGIAVTLPEIVVALAATLLLQLVPVNLLGVTLGEVASLTVYLAYGLPRPEALLLTTVAYSHRLVAAMLGGAVEAAGAWRLFRRGRARAAVGARRELGS